jgi:hypothetical protein
MGLKPWISERPFITDRKATLDFGAVAGLTIEEIIADPQQRSIITWAVRKLEDFDLHHTFLESAELDDDSHRDYWQLQTGYFWRHPESVLFVLDEP